MIALLRRKVRKVLAPVSGEVVALEQIGDEVFAQGLAGEGVAIKPAHGVFCAPIGGVVATLFATKHAFVIEQTDGFGVMVHIGIDTVELQGEGFEALIQEGDEVQAGDEIIKVDLDLLRAYQKPLITPVLLTQSSRYKKIEPFKGALQAGDVIMEVR